MADLNQGQLVTLQRYAESKGRGWKRKLRSLWETGIDRSLSEDDHATLRHMRNTLGPSWLDGFRLPTHQAPLVSDAALHEVARRFMDLRPDLASKSLDEWLAAHHDELTDKERRAGRALLDLF